MRAGKPMDELIAQHVFEWRNEKGSWIDPATDQETTLRPFSTDIAAAWEVVDRICERMVQLQLSGGKIWKARFYKSVAHTLETQANLATGSTPAEAICLAALAMRGVDLSGG